MTSPSIRQNLLAGYIDSGFTLVPIPLGTKGPTHKGWNEPSSAITGKQRASQMTSGNIGLAHAYCTPTPTAAVDVDDLAAAKQWFAAHAVDLDALIHAQDAVLIDSGRINRAKLLYRLPAGISPLPSVKFSEPAANNTVFEMRCGTKTGRTVQDVLPPSIHPDTGKPYQWAGNGHFSRLPVMPTELLTCWQSLLTPNDTSLVSALKGGSITRLLVCEPETPRRIATVKELLTYIDADCDYDTYRDIVWAVADTRWSCAYDLLREWSLSAPHRYEEETLQKLFSSYTCAGGIHYGTLVHHAKNGGWHE